MKIGRREMLRTMAGAVAAGGAWELAGPRGVRAAETADGRPPNLIFVLADDLGYGDLGCYGQARIQTPHLDRMAAEGVRFTQCYAGSTVCAPSRCALMTGLHTGHCRIRGNKRVPLEPEDLTVAEVLKGAGYTTGLVGKWGLGNPDTTGIPNRQGFDYFYGFLDQGHAHTYYPEYLWRNEEQVALSNVESEYNVATTRNEYAHDLFTDEALAFVEREQANPFFLYLAYTIPHANNERGRVLGDGMEVPDYGPYADEDWPEPEKGRAAMVSRLDRDMGRLFGTLKQLGLDEHTLVIFTSDNGPHKEGGSEADFFDSNGPLRGIKRDLYEGGIRVPGLARWPGRIAPGTDSDVTWTFWDILPTFAELGGAAVPAGLDGVSFAGGVSNRHEALPDPDRYLYWEFHERGMTQAARRGAWKGVRTYGGPLELYDLGKDVGETRDLAAAHPDVVADFEAYLATARTESAEWPAPAV